MADKFSPYEPMFKEIQKQGAGGPTGPIGTAPTTEEFVNQFKNSVGANADAPPPPPKPKGRPRREDETADAYLQAAIDGGWLPQ